MGHHSRAKRSSRQKISTVFMWRRNSTFSRIDCLRNNLLIEGFTNPNLSKTKPTLRENKTISLMTMTKREKSELIQVNPEIKVSTGARDL